MWNRRFALPLVGTLLRFAKTASAYQLNVTNLTMSTSSANTSPKRQRIDGQPLTIGTHNGQFHCDEVLACFMLKQLPEYENAKIFRSRNITELNEKCDIVVDVGRVFDHEKMRYDHHQASFQETLGSLRPEFGDQFNKIRLSSAGLIYCYYGERVIDEILKKRANISLSPDNLKLTFIQVYRNIISEIDAIDNGVPICPEGVETFYRISTGLSSRVKKLNPSWEENDTDVIVDKLFEVAMAYVGKEFVEIVLSFGGSWIKAREIVRGALVSAKSVYKTGEILLLPKCCPWTQHLADLEKECDVVGVPKQVIFKADSENWRVMGVPVSPGSFLGRRFFPESWRGLVNDELSKIVGVDGLTFVHHTGFIGGAKTKDAALAMAIKCVEWTEDT